MSIVLVIVGLCATLVLLRRGRPATLALLLAGCMNAAGGADKKGGKEEAVEEQPTPVAVGKVEKGEIVATISAASTIEAERQVTIHAESTGRIVDLDIEEGAKVKKGQLLAQIRFDAQTNALVRANTSLAKAQTDFDRVERLYQERVVGEEAYQQARNALEIAQLDLRDRSREMRNTKVTAPFDGTITQRMVTAGAFVSNGAQLFTVVDFNTLVARVFIPEKELDRIRVGQAAEVVGKAAKGRQGTGTLQRIAPTIDAATGTVKVTVSLPPEAVGPQGFLPGMYAEVNLTTDRRTDAALVPKSAIVRDEEQTYVFTLEGDPTVGFKARRVRVETGLQDADKIEIVKGVGVGDSVLVAGQSGLKDGAKVLRVDAQGKPVDPPLEKPEKTETKDEAKPADVDADKKGE
ncbi:MAG: efflux RND transporter periplasmic adaptor subunit [Myxococcales bacterium]|nr:efflux RND transporter periplasmic adaptor subunit [Myxococcales bacterium]